MKVGLGITTYNRPEYLEKCLASVKKHLSGVDSIWVYNDGSNVRYDIDMPFNYKKARTNKGVAHAKNWLLKTLLDEGCDYIFLLEDDIIIKSPRAISKYISLSQRSGIEHLSFAHHGEANVGADKLLYSHKGIELYRNGIGAYCMYTRRAINTAGYFDENFNNAWEHLEHTHRIAKAGLTTPWGFFADVEDSKDLLGEIPGSIDNSSIRPDPKWMTNIINGLIHWKQKSYDFPLNHILESLLYEEDKEYRRQGKVNARLA